MGVVRPDLDRPDVEAYVGMALRLMATELEPELARLLPDDDRTRSGDPWALLSICARDQTARGQLPPLKEPSNLGAAYRALSLRNRWAHPKAHEGMEPGESLSGIDDMIRLVNAFGGSTDNLEAVRTALASNSPGGPATEHEAAVPEDVPENTTGTLRIDESEISSRMSLRPDTEKAYEAAGRIRELAFASNRSVFGAETPTWTVENLEALATRLLDEKERGLDAFLERYLTRLVAADDGVVQLAAEVLYVHLWINAKSLGGDTKRRAVRRVLGAGHECADMPLTVADALDMGLVRTGPSFNQWRWQYLRVVVEVALELHRLPATDRSDLLDDPWRFRDWLMRERTGMQQRQALLHLLFPDTFEAIISTGDKEQIVERLGVRLSERTGDLDRDLFKLRRTMADEYGPRYDYYRPPVVDLWR